MSERWQVGGLDKKATDLLMKTLTELKCKGNTHIELHNHWDGEKVVETRAGPMMSMFTGPGEDMVDELRKKYCPVTPLNFPALAEEIAAKMKEFAKPKEIDLRKPEDNLKAEYEERTKRTEKIMAEENKKDELKKRFNPESSLIVIEYCFDNSDGMSDYYDRCHKIKGWVLKEMPKIKRRDLNVLKREVMKYPSLKSLQWSEHRKDYSDYGHSITAGIDREMEYNKKIIKHGFYKVDFGTPKYDGGNEDWPEKPEEASKPENKGEEQRISLLNTEDFEIRRNIEKNGVEIKFPSKPSTAVLDKLKQNGFRWGRFAGVWYKKYYEGVEEDIKKILVEE